MGAGKGRARQVDCGQQQHGSLGGLVRYARSAHSTARRIRVSERCDRSVLLDRCQAPRRSQRGPEPVHTPQSTSEGRPTSVHGMLVGDLQAVGGYLASMQEAAIQMKNGSCRSVGGSR